MSEQRVEMASAEASGYAGSKPPRFRGPRRPTGTSALVSGAIAAVFFGSVLTAILLVVWPGEMKLLAPIFCTDAQPEAFVVSDTYNPRPGETVTNFTLYCMGPDGDASDIGFLRPFLVLGAVHTLLIIGMISVWALTSAARLVRQQRRSGALSATSGLPDGSTPGPFA